MEKKILLWDNNGTIVGALDPDDHHASAYDILPGVAEMMATADCNVIISGGRSRHRFDENGIIKRFTTLMKQLPIQIAAFSPWIGGVACFVMIKRDDTIEVKKMHEDPRYKEYIGQFKKPDIGMFIVVKDLLQEEFGYIIDADNATMIGDSKFDEEGAKNFGIPFLHAASVHKNM